MDTHSSSALVTRLLSAEEKIGTPQNNSLNQRACQLGLFIPSLSAFFIYLASDSAWQSADTVLESNNVDNKFPAAVAVHYAFEGVAQAAGGYLMNTLLVQLNLTDAWNKWDIGTSFVTGFIWTPLALLGNSLSAGIDENDPTSGLAIVTTTSTIFVCNLAALYLIKGVKYCCNAIRPHNRTPSFTADSCAAAGFYLPGPLDLPNSRSGIRSIGWAGLFSACFAGAGEMFSVLRKKYWVKPAAVSVLVDDKRLSLNP